MKSHNLFVKTSMLTFILFLVTLAGCKKDDQLELEAEYRLIAWNHLDDSSKATVTGKVEDAKVEYLMYEGKEAAAVTFSASQNLFLGPIVVYIAIADKSVIGVAPRL